MLLSSLAMLQANVNQLTLPLVLLLLLLFSPASWAFDGRLSLGAALDTSDKTMRIEFPASVGEQLHLTQYPLEIYGKDIEQIKVYANGFVVLGNHSLELPLNYPSQTAYSKHRLSEMQGDFIGVFTTVNQCSPKGKIIIREVDVNEVESSTCLFEHIVRIGSIIDTAELDGEGIPFLADYVLTITWENMGCVPSSDPLTNTFTLALVRMEDRVYAIFQYDDIQWTADHSTSSLPPEAGIFIHDVDTPQLPRNNMHIEPSVWNEESNIAIPGEWLFPLNEGPIDVDVEAQSKIRMLTEDFLETSETNCADMVVSSPTSTVAGHDGTSFTSPTQESTTMTVPPTSYQTDSESSSSTDYANEVTYKPPSTTYEGVASEGVITNQETTSSYQTTSVKTTYDDFYSTSPSMNLQNCDSGTCKDPISTCFIFNGQNCCVCPSGYYGGGQEGCHPIKPKEARRIYVEGEVNIDLSDRKPITSSFVLDTEIRSANNLLTQSGTHNLPRNFSTIHALSPIFKVLNTFFALPREETSGDHIFNVFSLTSGFTAPFNFSFYVSVGRYGRLRVKGDLKRITSDRDTYKGSLNIRITPDGSFLPLNSPLVDSDGLIQLDNQRDHLIELERVEAGRVEFTPVTFNFISASGEKIAVEIKGDGAADVREGACLLADGSLLKIGQKYAFKLDSQGYCREDCQSEGSCSFYCIDMPIFAKSTSGLQVNSNPKTSVCQLELDAGPCRGKIVRYGFHRQKGHCIEFIYGGCQGNANNFESISVCEAECGNRDNEQPPQQNGGVCSLPIDIGPCRASIRRYAYNPSTRRCEIFTYGGCQGNGNNFETEEECERRCGGSGTVSPPHTGGTGDIGGGVGSGGGDVCSLPSDMGPCSDYVLRYTFNSSTGRCEMFYYGGCEGNENRFESLEDCQRRCESSVSRDPCAGVRCGNNAYCVSGYCYCEQGYEGDANVECRPVSTPERPPPEGTEDTCSKPVDPGPCHASIRRYAYNPSTRRCEIFTYGGCQGNGNNFETEEECERRCGGSGTVSPPHTGGTGDIGGGVGSGGGDVCSLPSDMGPCSDYVLRYTFNSSTGRCEMFYYGGCEGNENRFESLEDCQRRCESSVSRGHSELCGGYRCGENAECVNGFCKCNEGFYGDPLQSCRFIGGDVPSPNPKCRMPIAAGSCFAHIISYGYNSRTGRCEQFFYTGCLGNENRFNTYEECERECGVSEVIDPCKGVRCGHNAKCVEGRCVCEPGFMGDPNYECRSEATDRCRGITCGQNAQCIDGRCECLPGYEGDPQRECRNGEDCKGQRCGINAHCRDEVCICDTGYQGNPYTRCERISDRCDGVQCAANAFCEDGYCRCNAGYAGDGFVNCYYQGSCANVQCGVNALCNDGRCVCLPGYGGDPNRMCEPVEDPETCGGRRCGQNAVCDRGVCVCKVGYEGDAYYVCTEIPTKHELCGNTYCHPNARCYNGVCFCEYGYVGDGTTVCKKVEEDLCARVQCAENAECEAGLCQCKPGFKGDGFAECTPVEVDPRSCNGRYCGANAQCRDGQCVCAPGYTGDAYDICTRERPLPDNCHGVECGSNAYCQNGVCVCYEGFEGEPNLACKPIYDASCIGIRCGVNAYCTKRRCQCRHGYIGDPNQICYPEWGSSGSSDLCANLACHTNATCSEGQCHCNPGFEGDGFIDCWPKDPANLCDCRGMSPSIAGCSNGKCRCMPGFNTGRDNYCKECRGHSECAVNAQCTYDRKIQHYRCVCDEGYLGDGAIACIPGSVANRTDQAQCRVPCHRFATCDEYDGRCKCRSGYVGNGYTYCDFDCSQCLAEAKCVPESSQCICPQGYTGDGIRMCRPATSQGPFSLRIVKDSKTVRVREGSGALTLKCVLSGDVHNLQARWLTPQDVGRTKEQVTQDGRELWLTIDQPVAENSGIYVCQASRVSDTVNVIVESRRQAQTKQLFLTSDNGILTVQTQDEPTVAAQIWHIAENSKHKRIAITLDCKTDRLIYTSDLGHAIRFGNASKSRLNQPPELIFRDNFAKFTWLAVDPASGNVFAIDDEQGRIVVVNPEKPNQVYTLKKLADRRPDVGFAAGGIAVHPGLSLVYYAQMEESESGARESVIKVISMADPEKVNEITRVAGAPISISLAVTDDMTASSNTAGRLCWIQRRQLMPYSRTEIYCAQLDTTGRAIHPKHLLKGFDSNDEPSCGLVQDDYTVMWTSLYKKMYRSLNPSSSVYVKGVCCSNGFQSMAMYTACKRSMTNTCSYENGRCRFFCLPGGREMNRVCRCPDGQPNCIAEYA